MKPRTYQGDARDHETKCRFQHANIHLSTFINKNHKIWWYEILINQCLKNRQSGHGRDEMQGFYRRNDWYTQTYPQNLGRSNLYNAERKDYPVTGRIKVSGGENDLSEYSGTAALSRTRMDSRIDDRLVKNAVIFSPPLPCERETLDSSRRGRSRYMMLW
jgi:hypothetical protein